MPKTKKTRRGGVKHRARRLLAQYQTQPASAYITSLIGVTNHIDPEYEALFNQPELEEFERREGYNKSKPWPFTLVPVTTPAITAVSKSRLSSADPRRRIYTTDREVHSHECEYCDNDYRRQSMPPTEITGHIIDHSGVSISTKSV